MKKLYLLGYLFFLALQLFAQETISSNHSDETKIKESTTESEIEIDKNLIISKVNFNGLKRTKDSYLQPKFKQYIGKSVSEIDAQKVESEILQEGVFETAKITFSEIDSEENPENKTASIEIDVNEKITIIPLPLLLISSGGFYGGLFVIDANAFGVKDSFMVGGILSSNYKMGMASFSKPANENHIPGFGVGFSISKQTSQILDLEEEELFDYGSFAIKPSVFISEKITKNNELKLSTGFKRIKGDNDNIQIAQLGDAKVGNITLTHSYLKSNWNGFFFSGIYFSTSASFFKHFEIEDNSDLTEYFQTYSSIFSIQQPIIFDRFRLCGKFGGEIILPQKNKASHLEDLANKGDIGMTILPSGFNTDRILGGSVGAEVIAKKFKSVLLSLYANYECVWVNEFDLEPHAMTKEDLKFNHGPNGGVKLYFSKLALPAMSLGLSYNIPRKYTQFAFALGINM